MSRKRKNSTQPPQPVIASPSSLLQSSSSSRTRLLHLSLLFVLSFALYAPTLRNEFVTDDKLQILQNPLVLQGKSLGEAFTGDVWDFAHKSKENAGQGSNYYRPLQVLVYSAEYHFFGPNPLPWHLVNVLLNSAVVCLIYLLVASLATPGLAFWASLFFALHPMHTEPVAWIAALPELQCALFLLLAMLFYHRAKSAPSPLPFLAFSTLFYLAALFSKEPAILFPAVLLCYEFLYPQLRPVSLLSVARRLAPFLVSLAIYLAARISALGGFSPHTSMNRARLTLGQLFFAIPAVFARYVGKLFVPTHMNYFYAFPLTTTLTAWAFAGFLLGLLLLACIFYFRNSRPVLSFALCWFVLTLAPALSLNSVAINFFTERYLYIPSVGFSVLAASFVLAIYARSRQSSVQRIALGVSVAALFGFYIVQTERRVAIFHDNYSLLSDTVLHSPNSYVVQGQLAAAYYDRGEIDHAIEHVLLALQFNPDYILGHINAAWYFTDKGNYDAAIPQLKEAIRVYPDYLIPWVNLAKVYTLQQNWQLAAETYRHAATLDPHQSAYFLQLASLAEANGKSASAAGARQSAASPDPRDFNALVRLGDAASQAGQWQRAAQAFGRASALQPSNAIILDKWAISLQYSGDTVRATEILQRAVQLQPDSLSIRQAFAGALANTNRLADSTLQLRKILQLNPAWEHADQIHLALAVNAEKSGDRSTAVQEYQRALSLNPSLDFAT
ncbi:MAG TPA: tetratricopeptide repeat protein, partial [Candidatus Acidoferrum sp.]|nr:tetratricopeptide repeat protein [Candidatus Acidoferrum sp.]